MSDLIYCFFIRDAEILRAKQKVRKVLHFKLNNGLIILDLIRKKRKKRQELRREVVNNIGFHGIVVISCGTRGPVDFSLLIGDELGSK